MSKIEVPFINGNRLLKRWNMIPDELYQAIFFLFLPVYDSDFKRQDGIISEETITCSGFELGGTPVEHREGPNNLYYFDQYIQHGPLHVNNPSIIDILNSMVFDINDVKRFETKYGKTTDDSEKELKGLSTEDARELGRLRRERSKWDDSIKASLHIGLFCNELLSQGEKITRKMLSQKLFDLKFKDLPNTTIEKIWRAIPEKFRKRAGRPIKKNT